MKTLTAQQLKETLQNVGVKKGSNLLIHSALFLLGKPEGGVQMFLDTLLNLVGEQGTLAVPTFNFAFCKGETFDPKNTPADKMGVFNERFRQHPKALRTKHPMQSMAVIGKLAKEICAPDTKTSFEPNSSFDLLVQHDFDILYLGATLMASSIIHHSEQKIGVPYRYFKNFTSTVIQDQTSFERTYKLYVRDEKIDPHLTTDPLEDLLESKNKIKTVPLNYGAIKMININDFLNNLDQLINEDPWALIKDREEKIKIYQSLKS